MSKANNYYYDTVSEAINDLIKRGYTTDFKLEAGANCLKCNQTMVQLSPEEFDIDEIYRFEGDTDPGDEMIVYAIASKNHDLKGVLVNAYGMYADAETSKIVSQLQMHEKNTLRSPIKREEWLKPVSREHHHGLLLSWKIKTGLKKEIELTRIKTYANWFYTHHLLPHFKLEEDFIFPILGMENELIKKALSEHESLNKLFKANENLQNNLEQIMLELTNHIRFEERVLFNEIQKIATKAQSDTILQLESDVDFEDNLNDPFWE